MDSKLAGKIVAKLLTKSHHTLKHTSAILLCLLPSTSLYNFSVLIIYSKFPAYLQDISATHFAAFSIHLLSSQNRSLKYDIGESYEENSYCSDWKCLQPRIAMISLVPFLSSVSLFLAIQHQHLEILLNKGRLN